ncbi:PREDICTED: calvin cycle protein CP12-1, chloroplastic-like [Ipomoea nil]|uniref:calvin cycle protein CP12-1, chloroplastic-like n=1 Tax=Ipomoea nil TaxID=35883 RepID=UPI0009011181|nr:PREDICTED: calvin cycle protein CP12-1, chloroplastic-like [Ipomoea nil]
MVVIAGVNLTTTSPGILANSPKAAAQTTKFTTCLNRPWKRAGVTAGLFRPGRMCVVRPVCAAPDSSLSEKVADSVKNAEEACAGDPTSGECVAAWDEVEELSAAASHARDKKKDSNPLEEFCKDNPESEECRTYDN